MVSPLAPIQYKASSETYSVSRKDIEALAEKRLDKPGLATVFRKHLSA